MKKTAHKAALPEFVLPDEEKVAAQHEISSPEDSVSFQVKTGPAGRLMEPTEQVQHHTERLIENATAWIVKRLSDFVHLLVSRRAKRERKAYFDKEGELK